MIKYS